LLRHTLAPDTGGGGRVEEMYAGGIFYVSIAAAAMVSEAHHALCAALGGK
jgi:hypothetical protein